MKQEWIDKIRGLVSKAKGKSAIGGQMSNNKGGVCAGLCNEFLHAVTKYDEDFDKIVKIVMEASRGKNIEQTTIENKENMEVREHPFRKKMVDAFTKQRHFSENNRNLETGYKDLFNLYKEALERDNPNLGYSAQAPGLTTVNILNGINKLPNPGRLLVRINWESEKEGHAIAVAKNSVGSIIIYDPNVGVVLLPSSCDSLDLTEIVKAYVDINEQISQNKMSIDVKPFRNPETILTEIATLEAKLRNEESRSNPEKCQIWMQTNLDELL